MEKFIVELSARDIDLLTYALAEQKRAYRRKRSWKPSEIIAALVTCDELSTKLRELDPLRL